MNRMPLGAEEIAKARDNGMRPADPIVVSLCGWQPVANPQVVVIRAHHDWNFIAGLEAHVYVRRDSNFVRETLRDLAVPTGRLALWDIDAERGMDLWPVWKGKNVPELHAVPLQERRDALFQRWAKVTWLAGENKRYAAGAA